MSRPLVRLAAAVAAVTATGSISLLGMPAAHAAGLTSDAYFNNPNGDHPNYIRNMIEDRFDGAPSGSTVRVVMFNIDDDDVMDHMIAAYHRSVNIKVIVSGARCSGADRLTQLFGTNRNYTSWVHCADGSTRSKGGLVHQKSITFSETGGTPYVTLVGSANLTNEAWADQYTDMFQYADRKDVFDAYNDVFALQKDDQDMSSPYRTWTADDGIARANFFPVNDETPTAADDPVLTRLQNLPDNSNTTIVVANYSMYGQRGAWLVDELIHKKKAGATVSFIAGPPVTTELENRMKDAGISVVHGYDSDCGGTDHVDKTCNYIHLKAMVASYKEDGQWVFRSYTGSDNWGDDALNNDEVTQRIGGERIYDEYLGFFNNIMTHY